MSPVDGAGISNPNLPVDQALTEGRVPDRASEAIPELHEVDCPPELRERIEVLMSRYPDRHSASIPALWAVQERYGWCTPEGIRQAAAVMRVTPAYLESVASFYDLLHTEPVGTPPGRGLHQHQLLDARRRRAARRLPGRRRRARTTSSSPASSASAPATSPRWPRSTSATTARSRRPRRGDGDRAAAGRRARCCPEKALATRPLAGDTGRRGPSEAHRWR